ncbi:hypothetical protein D3C76_1453780 [compost metagenome]
MQAQRLRPGGGTAQTQFEPEFVIFAGFFKAPRKCVNDATTRKFVTLERGNHRGMTAAYMQQGGQVEVDGQLQLGFEPVLLAFAIQFRQVVVEAEFTYCTQLALAMQAAQPVAQFTQVLRAVLVEVDRVQAEGGV